MVMRFISDSEVVRKFRSFSSKQDLEEKVVQKLNMNHANHGFQVYLKQELKFLVLKCRKCKSFGVRYRHELKTLEFHNTRNWFHEINSHPEFQPYYN